MGSTLGLAHRPRPAAPRRPSRAARPTGLKTGSTSGSVTLADPGRQAQARAELDAYVAGHHLKELRKAIGKTQAEVAQILGVSQSRVSQIETGDLEAMELETLREFIPVGVVAVFLI
ncbi:hypothetical protein GCM10010402_40860 [Actinomadura luteofluorescens]|uniref:helix-turn-helix domain-containing protein n=1 Tax=Actinomadura luteofluorescens TaxID=46163 RepID=UPI0021648010|nr:helix-turn-helix transcriptional regulator [Actinomadura glauciflava]